MNKPTVKAYGLIAFTKKQYIITQAIGFALLTGLMIIAMMFDLDPILFGHAKLILGITILLELFETYFMMRQFRTAS